MQIWIITPCETAFSHPTGSALAGSADEQETIASCLHEIDFLAREIEQLDRAMALEMLACPQMRRLLALPGISGVAACTLVATIGDIGRFPSAGHLVGYVGLNPRVRRSTRYLVHRSFNIERGDRARIWLGILTLVVAEEGVAGTNGWCT